jgi:hypothetical protein
MAFSLPLPAPLPAQGWKVKIRDRERSEPPHATVLRKAKAWRFDLRSGGFLDKQPDPKDVPREVIAELERHLEWLRREWDEMYPENPVATPEADGE